MRLISGPKLREGRRAPGAKGEGEHPAEREG